MDTPAILIRFGNYVVLSLIAGIPLFLWLSLGRTRAAHILAYWRPLILSLLVASIILTFASLLASTAAMAGTPILPVDWGMVTVVLSATSSAKAIIIRFSFLLVMALLMLPRRGETRLIPLTLLALCSSASLAWGGHAVANDGTMGWLQLTGDILHIVAASLWIGGMTCLILGMRPLTIHFFPRMLNAFAGIGTVIVGTLVLTGFINIVLILGLHAPPALPATVYGRLIIAKLILFMMMLMLAAHNRFNLTPGFEKHGKASLPALHHSVRIEISLGLVILALIAVMGMIDPTL